VLSLAESIDPATATPRQGRRGGRSLLRERPRSVGRGKVCTLVNALR